MANCGFVRIRNTIGLSFSIDFFYEFIRHNPPRPPTVTCGHPSHPPPSPSPPNIPSQILGWDDLDSGCFVTSRENSLAGRPFEDWKSHFSSFFCISHIVTVFSMFLKTQDCANILMEKSLLRAVLENT